MDRGTASQLLDQWSDLGRGNPPGDAYQRLSVAVRDMFPEPDAYAAVTLNGDRAVLALVGDSLFIGMAVADSDDATVSVRKEPLDHARISVQMTERMEVKGPRINRLRNWTLQRDGVAILTMNTIISRGDAMYDGTPHAEAFAHTLCRAVGWAVPETGARP